MLSALRRSGGWDIVWIKRSEIVELSELIRKAIDGQEVDPRDHKEGALSILKNDIYTLINREKEQRYAAQKETQKQAEFLADISHQLKTPLTSLMLMSNILEDAPPEKHKEFLFAMKKELAHMEWMVSVLLKMAKLDSKTITFHPVPTSTDILLKEAIKPLEILLDIKSQEVEIRNQIPITCDPKWTTEALSNLLKNASECSGEDCVIVVDCGENPIYQWISIQDAGEGISPKQLSSLFRRFENSKNENGYGIGLPLALSIMRNQNGDIEVEPGGKGMGATFTLKFFR